MKLSDTQGSVAEWSKALVLGTSQKWRGFESHRCHEYLFTCTLTDPDAGGMKAIEYLHHRIKGGSLQCLSVACCCGDEMSQR